MKTNSTTSASNTRYKLFSVMPLAFTIMLALCTKTVSTGPVDVMLKGTVSIEKDLPQEFYGTWSVISTLIETNDPELFRKKSSDIWSFGRRDDVITLTNPVSGAYASITVKEVQGKTATFTRIKKEEDLIDMETAEITVEGDSFYGTDTIVMQHLRNGRRVGIDIVKYKVTGRKISGPTLKDIFAE